MRRNKSALKTKTVITSIVVCAAVCLAGIGYVWAKTQVWALSRDMKKLENRLEELKKQNEYLQRTYAGMSSPAQLDARVRELNLGLSAPLPSQIVRMQAEPSPVPPSKAVARSYAATNLEE